MTVAPPILERAGVPTEYVSVREAAAMLGVTEGTIRQAIKRGQLPAVRILSAIRIPLAGLRGLPAIAPSAPSHRSSE